MEVDTSDMIGLFMIFILVLMGLGLTNTVSDYAHGISVHNNSSDIVKLIAPFVPAIWLIGILGLAALLGVVLIRKHMK